MSTLVIQTVIRQWDKSQRSAAHSEARQQLPDRYPVDVAVAKSLFDGKVVLDQHGDDVMGERIQYELMDDDKLIIDRFGFDMKNKAIVYFPPLESNEPPRHLASLDKDWIQCQYEWRYRVYEGGFYYWLYEQIILNAQFVESVSADVFMGLEPETVFKV